MPLVPLYCPVHAKWERMDPDDRRGCDYCCGTKPCPYHPEAWEIDEGLGAYPPSVEVVVLDDGEYMDDDPLPLP